MLLIAHYWVAKDRYDESQLRGTEKTEQEILKK